MAWQSNISKGSMRLKCTSVLHVIANHHILLTNLICITAFIVQFGNILQGYIYPEQTNIRVSERNMSNFPLVFKICFDPGLNKSAIKEAGYKSNWQYMNGHSKYNRSIVGWAGHTNTSGVRGSVEEMVKKAQLYTAEEAIHEVFFKSMTDEKFVIELSLVNIWRMNYPYNCFTLDLTNNTKVQKNGLKTMVFHFKRNENTSVRIFTQGKSLACNRDIRDHQFYSSGDHIVLKNLGMKIK